MSESGVHPVDHFSTSRTGNALIHSAYCQPGSPRSQAKRATWAKEQEILRTQVVTSDAINWESSPVTPTFDYSRYCKAAPNKATQAWLRKLHDLRSAVGIKLIGGVDLSFFKGSETDAISSLVILSWPQLDVVYEDYQMVKLEEPYIPEFLAFREVSHLLKLIETLRAKKPELEPQVVLVDGNGALHPRGFGLACHLGVLANIPTVGIGKNLLTVDGLENKNVREMTNEIQGKGGEFRKLVGKSGVTWGAALIPTDDCLNPIYVSVGHRISLETALKIVASCCIYRIPEPVRQADLRSRDQANKRGGGIAPNTSDN